MTKPIQAKMKVSKLTGSKREYEKLEEKKQQYEQVQNQMKADGAEGGFARGSGQPFDASRQPKAGRLLQRPNVCGR